MNTNMSHDMNTNTSHDMNTTISHQGMKSERIKGLSEK